MNFGSLKSAVRQYLLDRSDLDAYFPIAVELTHSKIFSRARLRFQVNVVDILADSETITLPADFLGVVQLAVEGPEGRRVLAPVHLDTQSQLVRTIVSPVDNLPAVYAIRAEDIRITPAPVPPGVILTLTYQALPPVPAADADTNIVMNRYPGVYLFGLLVELGGLIADERLGIWAQQFESELTAMREREILDDAGRAIVQTSPGVAPV